MKKNVQLYTSNKLFEVLYPDSDCLKNCGICSSGDAYFNFKYSPQEVFSPNEIAEKINMPLWEVVMIDRFGEDEYALLFYEEG